jgi:hypothetical protein
MYGFSKTKKENHECMYMAVARPRRRSMITNLHDRLPRYIVCDVGGFQVEVYTLAVMVAC